MNNTIKGLTNEELVNKALACVEELERRGNRKELQEAKRELQITQGTILELSMLCDYLETNME